MKKLLLTLILVFSFVFGYSQNLKGTYLTEDYNSESIHSFIKVTYTFTKDSLYIDTYDTGCGIAAMSLKKISDYEYKATDTIYDIYDENPVSTTTYNLSFFPCIWDKNSFAVYRDNKIIDIIKKISK